MLSKEARWAPLVSIRVYSVPILIFLLTQLWDDQIPVWKHMSIFGQTTEVVEWRETGSLTLSPFPPDARRRRRFFLRLRFPLSTTTMQSSASSLSDWAARCRAAGGGPLDGPDARPLRTRTILRSHVHGGRFCDPQLSDLDFVTSWKRRDAGHLMHAEGSTTRQDKPVVFGSCHCRSSEKTKEKPRPGSPTRRGQSKR
jgi:hypothetical protein